MSQAVTVDTANGAPSLTLNDGASAGYDAALPMRQTVELVFDYAVGSQDSTTTSG